MFSENLRKCLELNRISQVKLSRDLNIPVTTISGYVLGTRRPNPDVLRTLADYFKVSVDYLLGRPEGNTVMMEVDKNDFDFLFAFSGAVKEFSEEDKDDLMQITKIIAKKRNENK